MPGRPVLGPVEGSNRRGGALQTFTAPVRCSCGEIDDSQCRTASGAPVMGTYRQSSLYLPVTPDGVY